MPEKTINSNKNSNRKKNNAFIVLFFFILSISILFISFYYYIPIIYAIIGIIGFAILLGILITYPVNIFPLIIALIIILPVEYYRRNPIPIGINDIYIFVLLGLSILFYIFWGIVNRRMYINKTINIPMHIILLYIIVIFMAAYGFLRGYKFIWILREIMSISFYFIPIIIGNIFGWNKKVLFLLLIIVSVFVMIEYVSIYFYNFYFHNIVKRVVTRQANIVIFALPILLFSFFKKENMMINILKVLSMVSIILLALFSLQRSIWVILGFDMGVFVIYYLYKNRFSIKSFIKVISIFIVIVLVGYLVLLYINQYVDIIKLIQNRFALLSLNRLSSDKALGVRFEDYNLLIDYIFKDMFLGAGLGAPVFQHDTGVLKEVIDNSYLIFVYKIGLIGCLLLLYMYLKPLYVLLKNKGQNGWIKIALGIMLINYMLLGISSSAMFLYRYNLIIGMIISFIYEYYGKESIQ